MLFRSIVSQPFYSKEIFSYILGNAKYLPDWKFIYKIHPAENQECFSHFATSQISESSNIEFVTNNVSIYKLFSESEYVFGIFSTAVFEAPYFGCKTLLLNLPGVEMAKTLIENGKAKLINTDEKLINFI